MAAAVVLLLIVASAVLAPWISLHDPLEVNIRHRLAPPAWMAGGAMQHPLGTDQVGRDLLARMIYGGRVSLVVGVVSVLLASSIGVIRAETLALRDREFVLASRALGTGHGRIIFRQIFPNLLSAVVVIATLQVAQVIILESFLSFLGLGIQPPTPAWGNMLGEGRLYMLNSWWIATFPGLAIFVATLAINLMGNALRDWLDPHLKL